MVTQEEQLQPAVLETLRRFLDEDIGYCDITTEALRMGGTVKARIFARSDCIVSGAAEVSAIFHMLGVEIESVMKDGNKAKNNETVLSLHGDIAGILSGERVALNLISRMSGIATLTGNLVDRCRMINPSVRIACTRKTTPGLRYFEKKAVMAGGGDPHRWGLDDAILIKDNHLARMPSITEAVRMARDSGFTRKVEIEVEDHEQAMEAAKAGADIIMLDNFPPGGAARSFRMLKEEHPNTIIEVSGGIRPENIKEYAPCADVISLGWLTHSVKAIDFSLDIE